MRSGVSDNDMDSLGDTGMVSIALMRNTLKDKDEFRDALQHAPFSLTATDWPTRLRIGSLVSAYEAAGAISDVQVKVDAERTHNALPPEVQLQEIINARAIFDKTKFELTDAMVPSKGYYERMIGQVETLFEHVPLSAVTSWSHDDINMNPGILTVDTRNNPPGGQIFRQTAKPYSIAMPKNPEDLRARFRTFSVCWVFMRMKFPVKQQLRTMTTELIDQYVEWLFGPRVWGMATLGSDDKATSTPTTDHVMRYDFRLRKKMADLMNEGFDIAAAIEMAKKDDELRQVYFISPVSLDIHSAASKACSAPGVEKPKSTSDPRPPALTSGEPSKAALKRAREQGKKEAESALRKQLAIAPPPGDFGSIVEPRKEEGEAERKEAPRAHERRRQRRHRQGQVQRQGQRRRQGRRHLRGQAHLFQLEPRCSMQGRTRLHLRPCVPDLQEAGSPQDTARVRCPATSG